MQLLELKTIHTLFSLKVPNSQILYLSLVVLLTP